MGLMLNNLQRLMFHKTQINQTTIYHTHIQIHTFTHVYVFKSITVSPHVFHRRYQPYTLNTFLYNSDFLIFCFPPFTQLKVIIC